MSESQIREIVRSVLKEYISRSELRDIENYADAMFKPNGVDVEFSSHFLDRVNDPRNRQEIESDELKDLFRKTYKKYGQKIPNFRNGTEAVINDLNSNLNIPFILKWNGETEEYEMVNKTVMRKRNFQTSNIKLKV